MHHRLRSIVVALAALAAVLALSSASLASAGQGGAVHQAGRVTLATFNRPSDCPVGHSCYYDGQNWAGLLWVAPSCGFFDLGKMNPPLNDRIESIYNGGGAPVQPYNWVGYWQPVGPPVPVGFGANYIGGAANIIDAVQVCS
jgi:hypothetical protein